MWIQPLSFRSGPRPARTVLRYIGETVEYVISSFDDDNEAIVHSEGRLVFGNGRADSAGDEDRVAIGDLKAHLRWTKSRSSGLSRRPATPMRSAPVARPRTTQGSPASTSA